MKKHIEIVNELIAAWKLADYDGVLDCLTDDIDSGLIRLAKKEEAFPEWLEALVAPPQNVSSPQG